MGHALFSKLVNSLSLSMLISPWYRNYSHINTIVKLLLHLVLLLRVTLYPSLHRQSRPSADIPTQNCRQRRLLVFIPISRDIILTLLARTASRRRPPSLLVFILILIPRHQHRFKIIMSPTPRRMPKHHWFNLGHAGRGSVVVVLVQTGLDGGLEVLDGGLLEQVAGEEEGGCEEEDWCCWVCVSCRVSFWMGVW